MMDNTSTKAYKLGNSDFWLYQIPDFLSASECEDLIHFARKNKTFRESVMSHRGINFLSENRKSFTTWISDTEHPIVDKITHAARHLSGGCTNFEDLQIVRYPQGGFFNPHYDADLDANEPHRRITILIYLNDDYTGGETHFPRANITVAPKRGTAIMFWTLNSRGELLEDSLHAGKPIISGVKWIANKWIINSSTPPPQKSEADAGEKE